MNAQPDEHSAADDLADDPSGDPTAVPAALGLGLLAAGGWLLATARPWQKPGSPLVLGLGWGAAGVLLLCGLVLLTRCIRTVHRPHEAPYEAPYDRAAGRSVEPPARPDVL
ncbi:hypothetical protein ACWDYJ_27690 [Streptomyces sp. NPDC003042]